MSSTQRTILSLAALSGFIVLAGGSSPELAEEIAGLVEEAQQDESDVAEIDWDAINEVSDAKRGNISAAGFSMASLEGRQIWLVNPPDRTACDKLEAVGMIVDCDTEWEYTGDPEVVIWCTEIPHVAAQTVLDYLNLTGFSVRTHQTNPDAAGLNECGELFEITVRWID
ncbi:MAG: hypothetical protein P8R54_32045 [Myxococcota bacterium]|nr:hypothetical protein [Myxococcota bacterium]